MRNAQPADAAPSETTEESCTGSDRGSKTSARSEGATAKREYFSMHRTDKQDDYANSGGGLFFKQPRVNVSHAHRSPRSVSQLPLFIICLFTSYIATPTTFGCLLFFVLHRRDDDARIPPKMQSGRELVASAGSTTMQLRVCAKSRRSVRGNEAYGIQE